MNLFAHRRINRVQVKMSDVMSALSLALDLVEGQPEGHAVRSCLIGMRLGRDYGLNSSQLSNLFYALLMKDLGCSSNAAKMCFLFSADDRTTKGDIKTVDWRNMASQFGFALRHVAPGKTWIVKAMRLIGMAAAGQRAGKELIQIRCERGAQIARLFGLANETANAIHMLDEHFDGGGHPDGLIGDQISILGRIMCLAQTAEVFLRKHGRESMREMTRDRKGAWFDPALCDHLLAISDDDDLWRQIAENPAQHLTLHEPEDQILLADDAILDNIALGFAQVVDAKSPWTYKHSMGVADVASGIAGVLGYPMQEIRDIRRAALLHDIGKLGVSNMILDKPAKLTAEEIFEMRKHPGYTQRILSRVAGFSDLAELAAAHHERLDGKGYHRGLTADQLPQQARILCISDMYEALAAKRPYREDMSEEQVMSILQKNCPNGVCPVLLDALQAFLRKTGFTPHKVAA